MKKRGLSLLEVLATLFLFSLVLGVVSQLLVNYQRIVKFSHGQDRGIQAALVLLAELRDEVREATVMHVPSTTTLETSLELSKPLPGVQRFPMPVPYQPPTGWTLFPSTSLVRLRYEVQQGELQRVVVSGLPATTVRLAEAVSDLQTRLLSGGNTEISLVVTEAQQRRTLVTSVFRW